jgi:hypothetical protein
MSLRFHLIIAGCNSKLDDGVVCAGGPGTGGGSWGQS